VVEAEIKVVMVISGGCGSGYFGVVLVSGGVSSDVGSSVVVVVRRSVVVDVVAVVE
jgi:hypothetical protein